jgi:hypothetical protein
MALITALAVGAAALGGASGRPRAPGGPARPERFLGSSTPWHLLQRLVAAGRPNGRLGLVQAQQLFDRPAGRDLLRAGLVRVRVPVNLIRLGEAGWRPDRFPDGRWMERLRAQGVPFKAVLEFWPGFTPEEHAAHAARLVHRARPDVVILGNEVNVIDRQPGVDTDAEIEHYLDRYDAAQAAIRAAAPGTRIQLYGEAYYGEPHDPEALLRRLLAALRRRGLRPPDQAGIHVYDRAEVLPARVAGYRRLFAECGLPLPLAVEEVGPRRGVVDRLEAGELALEQAHDRVRHASRLAELYAEGWLTEDEHAESVAQHLATAATCADQAQVFCALDFAAELGTRRGLVSYGPGRERPAYRVFRFMQRLLNDLTEARYTPATAAGEAPPGVVTVAVRRRDGLGARIQWSAPVAGETVAGSRSLVVPPNTFVCDAAGRLVSPPAGRARTLELPGATTAECGGAVRIFL